MKQIILSFFIFISSSIFSKENAENLFKGAFSEPESIEAVKTFDVSPFFKRDVESTKQLMALIKTHFPKAKERSSRTSSSSITLELDSAVHSLVAQFSNDSLYKLEVWGKRGKEKITKIAPLICAVSEYPQCVNVVTNMYKSLNGGTGLVKLRCADLKITVQGQDAGYEFTASEADRRDKRYSESCW